MTRKYASKTRQMLSDPNYNPNGLIDWLRKEMHLKSDAALARATHTSQTEISKMRQFGKGVGPSFILSVHETFGIPVAVIRAKMYLPLEQTVTAPEDIRPRPAPAAQEPAAPIIEKAPIDQGSLADLRTMMTKIGDAIGIKL